MLALLDKRARKIDAQSTLDQNNDQEDRQVVADLPTRLSQVQDLESLEHAYLTALGRYLQPTTQQAYLRLFR